MNKLTSDHFSFKCPMNWDDMTISGSGRHCSKCQKQVHDLTNCSVDEVIALQEKHGPICGSIRLAQTAVAALTLSAAACNPDDVIRPNRTTGAPLPPPKKQIYSELPNKPIPHDQLPQQTMRKDQPTVQVKPPNPIVAGMICSPEQLKKKQP
jgi:hypothetical protein